MKRLALADASYDEWTAHFSRVLGANLLGAANTSYCAAQHMIKNGGGRIINISSRGAFRGEPNALAYGASKAALNSLGQSMAKLLAPHNIFVGTVAPGFVETDMVAERLAQPDGDEIRRQSPVGRIARPEEVAYVALFLASEGAEFTTGTIVRHQRRFLSAQLTRRQACQRAIEHARNAPTAHPPIR